MRFVSGAIGSGKTAACVDMLLNHKDYKDRILFYHGLRWEKGFAKGTRIFCRDRACPVCPDYLEGVKDPLYAEDWHQWAPPNSVLFVDEAHHVWPQRGKEKASPEGVILIRESRHKNVSFLLASQSPMFVDVDIRRLTVEHLFFYRHSAGRKCISAPMYMEDPFKCPVSETSFSPLPKRVFGKYVSAESGISKFRYRPPARVIVMLSVIATVSAFIFWRYEDVVKDGRLAIAGNRVQDVPGLSVPSVPEEGAPLRPNAVGAVRPVPQELGDFTQMRNLINFASPDPRFPELAPAYRDLVVDVKHRTLPEMRACLVKGDDCRCFDQYAYPYQTTRQRCQAFIEKRERPYYLGEALQEPLLFSDK